MTEAQDKIPIYRGWEAIAKALEVSDDTATTYAARSYDPLPVYYDHAGRPCVAVAALEAWETRNALPFYAFHQLREAGKLPSQVDAGDVSCPGSRAKAGASKGKHSGQFGSARANQAK